MWLKLLCCELTPVESRYIIVMLPQLLLSELYQEGGLMETFLTTV